jgi:hypothetical protein
VCIQVPCVYLLSPSPSAVIGTHTICSQTQTGATVPLNGMRGQLQISQLLSEFSKILFPPEVRSAQKLPLCILIRKALLIFQAGHSTRLWPVAGGYWKALKVHLH